MNAPTPAEVTPDAPLVGITPVHLRRLNPGELALRFAFGAAISVLAGLVSIAFNPMVGGMCLAFPAILPATVTLMEKKEGRPRAVADVEGAALGAAGLAAFAAVARLALAHMGALPALALATAAWLAASLLLYLIVEPLRRRSPGSGTGRRRCGRDG